MPPEEVEEFKKWAEKEIESEKAKANKEDA